MSSAAHYPSVIDNKDAICVPYSAYSLSYDDAGGSRALLSQRASQGTVRFIVQRRERIVKNIYFRFLCYCSGNRKALLLTAGEVASALSHIAVITAVFSFNELCRLCDTGSLPYITVGYSGYSVADIAFYSPGEQECLL